MQFSAIEEPVVPAGTGHVERTEKNSMLQVSPALDSCRVTKQSADQDGETNQSKAAEVIVPRRVKKLKINVEDPSRKPPLSDPQSIASEDKDQTQTQIQRSSTSPAVPTVSPRRQPRRQRKSGSSCVTRRTQSSQFGDRIASPENSFSRLISDESQQNLRSAFELEDRKANADGISRFNCRNTLRRGSSAKSSESVELNTVCNADLDEKIAHLEMTLNKQETPSSAGRPAELRFMKSFTGNLSQIDQVAWISTPGANASFGGVIVLNAIYLGVETDLKQGDVGVHDNMKAWLPWFVCESIFLFIFTVELLLRLQLGVRATFRDLWNCFDAVLVSLGILDTWILQFVLRGDEKGGLSFLLLLRVVRLVRLARVLRLLRLFRFLRELTLLAQGILGAMRALGWALFLIWIVLYISAVLVTTLFGNSERPDVEEWFGSLWASLMTLLQLMTLEAWPTVVRGTMRVDGMSSSWLFFIPFIGLTNFVLLNVITGVVCERVLTVSEVCDHEEENKSRLKEMKKLKQLFSDMDTNNEGLIDKAQLAEGLRSPKVMDHFYQLGFMKYEIEHMYTYLEIIPNAPIRIADLVEGCLRSHGQALSKHLLRVQYDNLICFRDTEEQVMEITGQMKWLHTKIAKELVKKKTGRRKRHTQDNSEKGCGNRKGRYSPRGGCSPPRSHSKCSSVPESPTDLEVPIACEGSMMPLRVETITSDQRIMTMSDGGHSAEETHRRSSSLESTESARIGPKDTCAEVGNVEESPTVRNHSPSRVGSKRVGGLDKVALFTRLGEMARQQSATRTVLSAYAEKLRELHSLTADPPQDSPLPAEGKQRTSGSLQLHSLTTDPPQDSPLPAEGKQRKSPSSGSSAAAAAARLLQREAPAAAAARLVQREASSYSSGSESSGDLNILS